MRRRVPSLRWMKSGRAAQSWTLDIVLMVVGATVLVASALLAERSVYGWEVAIFQAINGLPGNLRPLLWVLNQYGTAITIPVATVVALAFRRWVLAAALAISGVTVYVLAKVIKGYVGRGRPSALIERVVNGRSSPRKASASHQAMRRWLGRSRSSCWPSWDVLGERSRSCWRSWFRSSGCTWQPTCHSI